MNLNQQHKLFVVTGATSGFGLATAQALLAEGALVIAVARGQEKLQALAAQYPDQVETLSGDITLETTIAQLLTQIAERPIAGLFVNAGGPPAKTFQQTQLADWDAAYTQILRWKVALTQALLPNFQAQQYGRIVYIESSSVKQPIPNLVLSTSLRLAVVGFVKTLSQDLLSQGITLNIIAPGYHRTPALDRLFVQNAQQNNSTVPAEIEKFESTLKIGKLGNPDNLGSLAAWLLSEKSAYISGQTISVDGGVIQFTMG
ncbi:MAG: hypothetical protein RIS47_2224 [Bacteroidota bacterium]|jgi:3-oxoacyl-[acyl-carrier protein] reductase